MALGTSKGDTLSLVPSSSPTAPCHAPFEDSRRDVAPPSQNTLPPEVIAGSVSDGSRPPLRHAWATSTQIGLVTSTGPGALRKRSKSFDDKPSPKPQGAIWTHTEAPKPSRIQIVEPQNHRPTLAIPGWQNPPPRVDHGAIPPKRRPPYLRNPSSAFTARSALSPRSVYSGRSTRTGRSAQTAFHGPLPEPEVEPWTSGQPYQHLPPPIDHWKHCHDLVADLDSEMCNSWKAEVDNLLIFAGLFSATVTAFIIDSYKWLLPEDTQNTVAEGPARRINIYWFLSLTLSLTTVLIGIICDQWIREYQRSGSQSPKARIALRQMRYEGLVAWEVPRIISYLPFLLQTAFVLFLLGIVELLWLLDTWVALPVTIFIGSIFFLLAFTVIAPAAQWLLPRKRMLRMAQCPYKSPQSLAVLRGVLKIAQFIRALLKSGKSLSSRATVPWDFHQVESVWGWSWTHQDLQWREMRDKATLPLIPPEKERSFTTLARSKSISIIASPIGTTSSPHATTPTAADDVVGALNYVTASFHPMKETIFSALHCIHELPFHLAETVVKDLYRKWGGQAAVRDLDAALAAAKAVPAPPAKAGSGAKSFKSGKSDRVSHTCSSSVIGSGDRGLVWDVLNAAFFETYVEQHPQVRASFWESRIRIMNQFSPVALETTMFAGLPSRLVEDSAFLDLPEDIHLQLLDTFHTLIRQDTATAEHVRQLWSLLKVFLAPDPRNLGLNLSGTPLESTPGQHRIQMRQEMVFSTFTLLNSWLLSAPFESGSRSSYINAPRPSPTSHRPPPSATRRRPPLAQRFSSAGRLRTLNALNNSSKNALVKPKALDQRRRVQLCIAGIYEATYLGVYEVWAQGDNGTGPISPTEDEDTVDENLSGYARLQGLIFTLNGLVNDLGGWEALEVAVAPLNRGPVGNHKTSPKLRVSRSGLSRAEDVTVHSDEDTSDGHGGYHGPKLRTKPSQRSGGSVRVFGIGAHRGLGSVGERSSRDNEDAGGIMAVDDEFLGLEGLKDKWALCQSWISEDVV